MFQNSDIIILDRPTRNTYVYENYQHVQSWNPTIICFENPFSHFSNIEKWIEINLNICLQFFLQDPCLHKDTYLFIPKTVISPEK